MTYDSINPSHYRGDRKFEPIEVIEDWGLNYRLGNAVKYISRNGRKPSEDPREGLRKAIWYLEREIAALDGARPYRVEYEDVLDYYGQTRDEKEAWPDVDDQQLDYWDPTLGPVEIDPLEVAETLSKKDLNQFDDDEIVATKERRGLIIGFKKDGSSCVLRDGRCE